MVLIPKFGHRLTEIYLDASIVHERIVHFKVRLLRLLLGGELGKGVLQRLSRVVVADNFHLDGTVKARKNEMPAPAASFKFNQQQQPKQVSS